jgi:hypothetical protein
MHVYGIIVSCSAAEETLMLAYQLAIFLFGLAAGCGLAMWLRRTPGLGAGRERSVFGFGVGAAIWVAYAALLLPEPFAWMFVATVLAIYLPPIIVIRTARANGSADAPAGPGTPDQPE